MRLHPASLLVSAGLLVSVMALLSAAPQSMPASPGVVHHDIAHPRNFVEIIEGQPYTVPSARLFVVTNVGRASFDSKAQLVVNGAIVMAVDAYPGSSGEARSVMPIGRYVCQPGDTVAVLGNPAGGRAWGFLTDL